MAIPQVALRRDDQIRDAGGISRLGTRETDNEEGIFFFLRTVAE